MTLAAIWEQFSAADGATKYAASGGGRRGGYICSDHEKAEFHFVIFVQPLNFDNSISRTPYILFIE